VKSETRRLNKLKDAPKNEAKRYNYPLTTSTSRSSGKELKMADMHIAGKIAHLRKVFNNAVSAIGRKATARRAAARTAFNRELKNITKDAAGQKAAAKKKFNDAVSNLTK
jgi:hypothetical protein